MLEPRLAFRRCIVRLFDESLEALIVHVRNVSQRSDAVDGILMLGRCMLEQAALTLLTPSTAFCDCSVTKVLLSHRKSAHSFSGLLVTFQRASLLLLTSRLRFISPVFTTMETPAATSHPAMTPHENLPAITVSRMLDMTTTSRRFKIDLTITEAKNSNLQGKPVPDKTDWQQHTTIAVIGQDSNGQKITIEAADDDLVWLGSVSKLLRTGRTVTLGQPIYSQSG
jgi:hypothetical protein